MRKRYLSLPAARALILGLLVVGPAALLPAQEAPAGSRIPWPESPYRSFGPPRELSETVVLRDEADDPGLRRALAEEIGRLSVELFDEQGWPMPFAAGDPLRIFVARRPSEGVRRLAARSLDRRHFVRPTIQIDGADLSGTEIVREAARLYALAAISSYAVPDRGFATAAAAELLSGGHEREAALEASRAAAASPTVILADHARTMGRALLEEFTAAAGGRSALRMVWERASERGEDPLTSLVRVYTERTGGAEDSLLLRSSARIYATVETEAGPANLGLYDLEAGALDASAPEPWTLRHRVSLPGDNGGALRFQWPAGAGSGAAVIRYRDHELPSDVLFLEPASAHTVPLSGVERVDWIVAGSISGAGPAAPVFFEVVSGYPFDGLVARAAPSPMGSGISWTTASHEGLSGWAVFREEVQADGRITRAGPQIVPASARSAESFRYAYLDAATRPGTYYRYNVWAVTDDGLLARAFSATLRTPE
jgi:hypothetical protein